MLQRIALLLLFAPLWLRSASAPVFQTEPQIELSLSRDFGYSSGTGRIQGTFSLRVSGPETLTRVIFLIDGKQIGEDTQAPYRLQFNTDAYELGVHTMQAVGYTLNGVELRSKEQRREFVSSEEGWQAAGKIAIPILIFAGGAVLLTTLLPLILGRGKKGSLPLGAPRNYGTAGGTICPKCSRPFGMHLFGLNLLVGKLDRCPHCGRWNIVRRVSPQELRAAELRELENQSGPTATTGMSEADRLRKDLEDSRYQDIQE